MDGRTERKKVRRGKAGSDCDEYEVKRGYFCAYPPPSPHSAKRKEKKIKAQFFNSIPFPSFLSL